MIDLRNAVDDFEDWYDTGSREQPEKFPRVMTQDDWVMAFTSYVEVELCDPKISQKTVVGDREMRFEWISRHGW